MTTVIENITITKWLKPNNTEYGMHYALSQRVKEWLEFGNGFMLTTSLPNDFFTCERVIVHSYREVGTSLEVNVELKYSDGCGWYITKLGRLILS